MKKKIKIIFIGSVLFSKYLIESLNKLNFIEIVAVITKKRKKIKSDYCDLTKIAKKHNLKSFYVDDINSERSLYILNKAKADYIFCFGWSQILKKRTINAVKKFVIGYHPSDLPSNRGRHPIIWAIALGLKKTASCFFKMNEKPDDGKVLSKKYILISNQDNAYSLYLKLVNLAKSQLKNLAHELYRGKLDIIKEKKKEKNYWRKRNYDDGKIDWRMTADSINNLIKALSHPYDGAHFMYKSKEYIVFYSKVIKISKNNIEPGKILTINRGSLTVKCGLNALQLKKIKTNRAFKTGEYLK